MLISGATEESKAFCSGTTPTCITGTPTCADPGAGSVTCDISGRASDCSTSGLISIAGSSTPITVPGAQDACTCNIQTGNINPCNRPSCTAENALPTCPSGVVAICADYDSSDTAVEDRAPVCSTLGVPQDHLGNVIPLPANPNNCATINAVPNCPVITAPACTAATKLGECSFGALTCDNRPGLQPVCSLRSGAGVIVSTAPAGISLLAGAGLCNVVNGVNTANNCAACNDAGNSVTCPGGQTAVCCNYDSSSLIRPAPMCVNTASVPEQKGIAACNSNVISCGAIPPPTCSDPIGNANAQCAVGTFTCDGRAANEAPVCSVVPGAVELRTVNACFNNNVRFLCGAMTTTAICASNFGATTCPAHLPAYLPTCDTNAGTGAGNLPVCTLVNGVNSPTGPAASCTSGSLRNCA